jgi:hypothetical protein
MNHNFFATSGITVPYIVMTAYEQLRNENIRRNEEFLNTLFPKGETIIPIVKLKNKKKVQEESNILPKRKSNRLLSSHQDNNVHLGPLVDGVLINNNNNNNKIHCTSSTSSIIEASSTIIRSEKFDRIDAIKLREYIDSKSKDHSILITDTVIPIIHIDCMHIL